MKAYIFTRVSTEKQHLEQQKARVIAMAKADGYTDAELVIPADTKESAICLNEDDRVSINRLKSAIKADPEINAVYCFEISRLARRMDVLVSLTQWFRDNHIQLVCDEPSIRLFNADGSINRSSELILNFMGTMAQQEMEIKKERFANGKALCRQQGRWDGSTLPLGYTLTKDNYIVVDEEGAALVRSIFEHYATGDWSTTRLANELREKGVKDVDGRDFTQSRVATILSKKRYTGYIETTKSGVEFSFPQIVTPELFEQCETLRKGAKVARKHNYASAYLCNKLIECKCGYHYTASNTVYRCFKEHDEAVKKVAEAERLQHTEATLSIAMMDGIVWQLAAHLEIARLANQGTESLADYKQQLEIATAKAETAKAEIAKLPAQREKIMYNAARYNMSDEQVDKLMEKTAQDESRMKAELQAAQSDVERLSAAIYKLEHPVIDINLYESLKENLPENIEKKRAIVRSYIKRITVSDWETMTLNNMVTLFKSKTSEKRYLIITVEDFNGTEYKYRYFPRWSFGKSRLEEMLSDESWSELVLAA